MPPSAVSLPRRSSRTQPRGRYQLALVCKGMEKEINQYYVFILQALDSRRRGGATIVHIKYL